MTRSCHASWWGLTSSERIIVKRDKSAVNRVFLPRLLRKLVRQPQLSNSENSSSIFQKHAAAVFLHARKKTEIKRQALPLLRHERRYLCALSIAAEGDEIPSARRHGINDGTRRDPSIPTLTPIYRRASRGGTGIHQRELNYSRVEKRHGAWRGASPRGIDTRIAVVIIGFN